MNIILNLNFALAGVLTMASLFNSDAQAYLSYIEGEPHLRTWAGENYDFQGVCDLVLLENHNFKDDLGMDIHVRTKEVRQWSYISNVAVRIGKDIFELTTDKDKNLEYYHNFVKSGVDSNKKILSETLYGYPIMYRRRNSQSHEFTVEIGGDDNIVLKVWGKWLGVTFNGGTVTEFDGSRGLMGSFPEGKWLARDNQTIIKNADDFGNEWQVLSTEPKLFHNFEGPQHPQKCHSASAVEMRRRLGESTISQEEAEIACSRVADEERDMCIFDVMATNDFQVAGAY